MEVDCSTNLNYKAISRRMISVGGEMHNHPLLSIGLVSSLNITYFPTLIILNDGAFSFSVHCSRVM
ncbi:hypothetical transcript [Echinococcus multilocularis]|uniref:Hypothetical transcript n=1 Tax=Echinococcus multilocularis TaxID=6211 RepID=A0A068Y5H9_ECHMU|nr:hypothetical transcript [Echinococcus multilocularis]